MRIEQRNQSPFPILEDLQYEAITFGDPVKFCTTPLDWFPLLLQNGMGLCGECKRVRIP